MKQMIKVIVEGVGSAGVAFFDVPDGWSDMSPAEQEDEICQAAIEHRENVASCGGVLVEVEDDFQG